MDVKRRVTFYGAVIWSINQLFWMDPCWECLVFRSGFITWPFGTHQMLQNLSLNTILVVSDHHILAIFFRLNSLWLELISNVLLIWFFWNSKTSYYLLFRNWQKHSKQIMVGSGICYLTTMFVASSQQTSFKMTTACKSVSKDAKLCRYFEQSWNYCINRKRICNEVSISARISSFSLLTLQTCWMDAVKKKTNYEHMFYANAIILLWLELVTCLHLKWLSGRIAVE